VFVLTGLNPLSSRLLTVLESSFENPEKVSFKDFVKATNPFSTRARTDDKLKLAFKIYDVDNDGKIGRSDLTHILELQLGVGQCDEAEIREIVEYCVTEIDIDGDGFMSYEDFTRTVGTSDIKAKLTFDL